ncbi:hypothetical protein M9H77_35176 [Catharanthus roseus]|uniref:Uncharacterized protein n=1 Tax=Catharanthus roseus TaxID=4058 RepID=A0ACB9ZPJ0_CATRO|nr:hypothetical protein M9H77_35176 [Catharanthus roseus]
MFCILASAEVIYLCLKFVTAQTQPPYLSGLVCPCMDGVGEGCTTPEAIFFGISRGSSSWAWKSNLTGLLLVYLSEDVSKDNNANIDLFPDNKGIYMCVQLSSLTQISNSPVALTPHMPDHFAVITYKNFPKSQVSIITSSSEQDVVLDEWCSAFSAMPLLDSTSIFISYVFKDPKRSFKGSFVSSFTSSIATILGQNRAGKDLSSFRTSFSLENSSPN